MDLMEAMKIYDIKVIGRSHSEPSYWIIVYLSEDTKEIHQYLDTKFSPHSVYYPPALEMPVAEIEHNHFRTGREAAEALKQWLLTHEGTMSKYAQSFIKENIQ